MPGRNFNPSSYRFLFNSKEQDPEIKGTGNSYDYGARIYDPRCACFLSIDPLSKDFPWYSPYQFAGNNPILNVDLDGLEEVNYLELFYANTTFPYIHKRDLNPSEWLQGDRYTASGTFAKAAKFNTATGNTGVYQPINQIHNYYQWGDAKLQRLNTDIRFFSAAEKVTDPFTGVGASQHAPGRLLGGFSQASADFLEAGNKFLFEQNLPALQGILETGTFQGLTGIAADFALVEFEQGKLEEFIGQFRGQVGEEQFSSIIGNINKALNQPPVELGFITRTKEQLGGSIDFSKQAHREALGKNIVRDVRKKKK